MPCYNSSEFIFEAINSILVQSHQNIELIAIDDGSTDKTFEILQNFNDKRIKIIRQKHSGIINALNNGLKNSSGEYIARMDSDDIAMQKRFEYQLREIENSDADIIGGVVEMFANKGSLFDGFKRYGDWLNSIKTHKEIIENIFIENPIPAPTLFMKKDALIDLKGYDNNVYPDDYNLIFKAYIQKFKFSKTNRLIIKWRDHDARMSRTTREISDQRFYVLKVKYLKKILKKSNKEIIIWGIGKNGKKLFKECKKQGLEISGFTAKETFIKEKSLYDVPLKTFTKYKNPLFLLATASKNGRKEIISELKQYGFSSNYFAFC